MPSSLVMVKYTDAAKAGIVGEGGYASRVESLKTAAAGMGLELGDYWVCNSQEVDAAFFIHTDDLDDAREAALSTLNEAQGHIAEWRIIPVVSVDAVDAQIANLTGKAVEPPK